MTWFLKCHLRNRDEVRAPYRFTGTSSVKLAVSRYRSKSLRSKGGGAPHKQRDSWSFVYYSCRSYNYRLTALCVKHTDGGCETRGESLNFV